LIPDIRISTDRLTLRIPQETDYGDCADFMRSARSEYVGGPLTDEFALWRGFLGSIGHWALRDYGMFMVDHDGRCVGRVGIIYHVMWDEPELGWHLFDGQEGKGYATEAAAAARDWAVAERGLGPLVSYIAPGNTRSIAVAERLGAVYERDTTLLGMPAQVWRHTLPDSIGGRP
jgi:RimJ/RimL family protein N-acetyltransferase